MLEVKALGSTGRSWRVNSANFRQQSYKKKVFLTKPSLVIPAIEAIVISKFSWKNLFVSTTGLVQWSSCHLAGNMGEKMKRHMAAILHKLEKLPQKILEFWNLQDQKHPQGLRETLEAEQVADAWCVSLAFMTEMLSFHGSND